MLGVRSRSGRLAAVWLTGTALAVLALTHAPAAASWAGAATGAVSDSDTVALPAIMRLLPAGAHTGPSSVAVLPPTLLITLLGGLAAAVLAAEVRRARSRPLPRPARGPPSRSR